MSLAVPKKKKLIKIIIIVAGLTDAALNEDPPVENMAAEQILDQLGVAKPILFDVDENNWTEEQTNAWDACDAIYRAFVESQSDPTESEQQALCDDLATALASI